MSKLRLIDTGHVINLTPEESVTVAKALLNPRKPGPRLRAAFRRYKIMVKSST